MDEAKLKSRIQEIAASATNVRFDDLINLLDRHIKPFCEAHRLGYNHHHSGGSHHAFTVGRQTFNVTKPHKTSLVKRWYVADFLRAMEEINLFEER